MTKLVGLWPAQGAGDPAGGGLPDYSSGALTLAALMQRPAARGLYYHHKKVQLDGYKFVECRFDACHLMVASANFEFDHCIIDSVTTIEWQGEIVKALRLFNSKYDWAYTSFPAFAPTRNEDGTISIDTRQQ